MKAHLDEKRYFYQSEIMSEEIEVDSIHHLMTVLIENPHYIGWILTGLKYRVIAATKYGVNNHE